MGKVYTFEMKKSLANRIQKLNNKKDLLAVKKIITDNNSNLDEMKNSNGIFMRFQNLTNGTYDKIKKLIDTIEKQQKLKEIQSSIIDSETLSEEVSFVTDNSDSKNMLMSKKYRLTNEETNLMNRIKYEKILEENSKTEDDIFVQTSSNKKSYKKQK